MLSLNNILIVLSFLPLFYRSPVSSISSVLSNLYPDPEAVVQHVQSSINASVTRRRLSSPLSGDAQCLTGNPIDDCWRCAAADRQQLADCGIGFGRHATGGKGGRFYTVHSAGDNDPANPSPGTLRHAVVQSEPLWIIFQSSMIIYLNHELVFNSFKTIDGRGADIHITGYGCITLQHVSNVIIHNVRIYGCRPAPAAMVRISPAEIEKRGGSDGDGISILSSREIWIDHCSLSDCSDGLIDVTLGSTAVTISNNYFAHHDEVMLLGHSDSYSPDSAMQVTIGFNYFGEGLVQRMPRCRWGYIHVVNNDFTEWQMYAIGGSASPTINSQGNRYIAPQDPNAKEVTKRLDMNEKDWLDWNWRTEGDILVNGAFFVPSGDGASPQYTKASSIEPKSGALVEQLTINSGVLDTSRDNGGGNSRGGANPGGKSRNGGGAGDANGNGDHFGMIFGSDAVSNKSTSLWVMMVFFLLFMTI